jgi:CubicO group peptidase (beta-lactamase class C family)
MKPKAIIVLTITLLVTWVPIGVSGAADQQDAVKSAVDKAIQPVMAKYEIPGMVVGITVGRKHYVLDYGVASTKTRKPITDSTLFEIGSVSKTFTATLASWAQVSGQLSLSDKTSKYLPSLQGTKFGEVSLLNLGMELQHAITNTHSGYFKAGVMTQDLVWEQYSYPVDLKTLLEGNSYQMILEATPVTQISPPMEPRKDVLINKTGSTNGFGAYVAFVPEKQMGIVILANKNYPIDDRITIAHQITSKLVP